MPNGVLALPLTNLAMPTNVRLPGPVEMPFDKLHALVKKIEKQTQLTYGMSEV